MQQYALQATVLCRAVLVALMMCWGMHAPVLAQASSDDESGSPSAGQGDETPSFELDEDARLWTRPPRLRFCGQPVERIEVEVFWDASALGVDSVQILLDDIEGPRFAGGGSVGNARTGNWVVNGKRFLLYLPGRDKVVAEKTFQLLPCDTKEFPFAPD